MGMVLELYAVRGETLRRLLADPPLIWKLIAPDDAEIYESARAESRRGKGGFLSRLFGGEAQVDGDLPPLSFDEDEGSAADLDKSWHGLHFLLTGTDEAGNSPMDFLAVGGEAIGDVDVGYGPARAFSPEAVADIATRLADVSDAELIRRFDGPAMSAKNIYPDIWQRDEDADFALDYLRENLVRLRHAVAEAARRRQALIAVLS